jgi:hypothetical protein
MSIFASCGTEFYLRNWAQRAILYFTLAPVEICKRKSEICPLGGMFTPSFTPRGEHSLLLKRME